MLRRAAGGQRGPEAGAGSGRGSRGLWFVEGHANAVGRGTLAGMAGRVAVVPEWSVPAEGLVRLVRWRAGLWCERSGGEARYRGIVDALDWAAGVRDLAPVSALAEAATAPRVVAEVLVGEFALDRSASAEELERRTRRLGQGIVYPAGFGWPASPGSEPAWYVTGVLDALRWLLGEVDRPPVSVPIQDGQALEPPTS